MSRASDVSKHFTGGNPVIYVDTIADLQALDTSGLVEGQAASVQGSEFRWDGSEWRPTGPVSVRAFGELGEQSFNDAQEYAHDKGVSVYVPSSIYTGDRFYFRTSTHLEDGAEFHKVDPPITGRFVEVLEPNTRITGILKTVGNRNHNHILVLAEAENTHIDEIVCDGNDAQEDDTPARATGVALVGRGSYVGKCKIMNFLRTGPGFANTSYPHGFSLSGDNTGVGYLTNENTFGSLLMASGENVHFDHIRGNSVEDNGIYQLGGSIAGRLLEYFGPDADEPFVAGGHMKIDRVYIVGDCNICGIMDAGSVDIGEIEVDLDDEGRSQFGIIRTRTGGATSVRVGRVFGRMKDPDILYAFEPARPVDVLEILETNVEIYVEDEENQDENGYPFRIGGVTKDLRVENVTLTAYHSGLLDRSGSEGRLQFRLPESLEGKGFLSIKELKAVNQDTDEVTSPFRFFDVGGHIEMEGCLIRADIGPYIIGSSNRGRQNVISTAPSLGHWAQGTILYRSSLQMGGNLGWVCAEEGEPGTWIRFGELY